MRHREGNGNPKAIWPLSRRTQGCRDAAIAIVSTSIEIILDRGADISNIVEMKSSQAILALSALAQEHRLGVFRLLVETGPRGLPAGRIAQWLGLPNSSLSHHLAQLHEAGLVTQHREGRSLVYAADYVAMDRLIGFLTENCCRGADCSDLRAERGD